MSQFIINRRGRGKADDQWTGRAHNHVLTLHRRPGLLLIDVLVLIDVLACSFSTFLFLCHVIALALSYF